MAVALAFASFLLSESAGDDAAKSNAKAMLAHWEHPDLHFTYPTIKKPNMGSGHQPVSDDFVTEWHQMLDQGPYFTMEQWMERMGGENQQALITGAESDEIVHKLSLKSSQGGYKVCLIWLPERMNLTAANKFLKTLEEPPQDTVFLMVSEHPELLLETIRSRTQRFDLKRIPTADIEKALVERRGIDEDSAHRIARVADGNWNLALRELEAGNENQQFLDLFILLMRLAYMRNVHDLKKWADNLSTFGREKQKRMLAYFLHLIRENFMYNFYAPELLYMTRDEENFSRNFARFINESNIVDLTNLLEKALQDIGRNANPKIVFFDIALQMILLLIRKS